MDSEVLQQNINTLDLSIRTKNCLNAAGILLIKDLIAKTETDLLKLPNFGTKCLNEIKALISNKNLALGSDISNLETQESFETKKKYPDEIWLVRGNNNNWLQKLSIDNPALTKKIQDEGIFDDLDYQKYEERLDPGSRIELAIYRVNSIKPTLNLSEISSYCRILPPWTLKKEVSKLQLSVRTANRIPLTDIKILSDFQNKLNSYFFGFEGFGRKSIEDLKDLFEGIISNVEQASFKSNANIFGLLEEMISILNDKEKVIFKARFGWDDKYKTLEETSSFFDVTRERVRQIEAKYLTTLERIFDVKKIVTQKLSKLMENRYIPLFTETLSVYDEWFKGIEEKPWLLGRVVDLFEIDEFSITEIDNKSIIHRGPKDLVEIIINEVRKIISENRSGRITAESLKKQIENQTKYIAPELSDFLYVEIIKKYKIVNDGLEDIVITHSNKLESLLFTLLETSEQPLHVDSILENVTKNYHITIEERYVRASAGEHLLLFGPSLYGLREHLKFTDEEVDLISEEVAQLIYSENYPNQWHCDQVLQSLESRKSKFFPRLNKYTLSLILNLSQKFNYVKRLSYTNKNNSSQPRLEFFPMVVKTLENSDKPMKTEEIISVISKERGIGKYSQIFQKGNVISVDESTWGLLDKHVFITNEEYEFLIEDLKSIFGKIKTGLSYDEIKPLINPEMLIYKYINNLYLLYSLAQRSELFKRDREYLYLISNDSPKRLTLGEAFEQAVESFNSESFSTNELLERASKILGSVVKANMTQMFNVIKHNKYIYDSNLKKYIKNAND